TAAIELLQPGFAHAVEETLHEFRCLIRNGCPDPVDRQFRVRAAQLRQYRSCFIRPTDLSKAGAAQALRAVEAGPQPDEFLRISRGVRVTATHVMRDRNPAEEHRR